MAPLRSVSQGGFGNSFSVPLFPSVEFPKQTNSFASSVAASPSMSSSSVSSMPCFGTSNTASVFNSNSTSVPAFGFPPPTSSSSASGSNLFNFHTWASCSQYSSFVIPSTSSSMLSSSVSPTFGFQSSRPGFDNTRTSFAFGQKPTANFSFSPSLHTNNSANPFSASPFSSKSVQPPLSSQCGGSRMTSYSASKMVDEDCMKILSISAMPVYGVKSHEELRWEDHQQSTKANPFSASLHNSNKGQPPFASQHEGSGVARYTLTKKVGEDSGNIISISAMPVYDIRSHEELRWEDYQMGKGGSGAAGALNWKSNLSVPSPSPIHNSEQPSPSSFKPLNASSYIQFPPFPKSNVFIQTSEHPPSFSFEPLKASSSFPFPPLPNANIDIQTSEKPSPFSFKPLKASSSFQFPCLPTANIAPTIPPMVQPSTSTPLSSTTTNLISGERRIQQSPTNSNPTIGVPCTPLSPEVPSSSPSQNLNGTLCTACGCIKTNAVTFQFQRTPESCQTESADPAAAELRTMADNIVPVKDPFGVQSSKSQLLADHAAPATSTQIGISSMPVVDKPAPSRISSLLTPRHVSQRQSAAHSKISQPNSDVKKVPFFIQADPHGIPRQINHPIPRENPKSAFMMNVAEPTDESLIEKTLQLKIASTYPTENSQVEDDADSDQIARVVALPKLTRSDYYTEPLISELEAKESMDPGFCGRVRGFVIGRHGYGKIEFEGETDVRGIDLDSLVEFTNRQVAVYKDESKKAAVGEGLNKPAVVTLLNVICKNKVTGEVFVDGEQVAKYAQMLKRATRKQGAEFVSYDPVKGEWRFRVHHF